MKSAKRTSLNLLLGIGLMISSFAGGAAQTYTATVTGSVTDTTGAVVPNVRVVAANQETQLEYTAQSNADGVYTIPFLPIGKYTISIEASAFKKLVLKDIRLEVNQSARVDLKLEVGDFTETVTVTDVAPILQTENATVGQVISGDTMVNLPLNGRNFQQLTLLVPGAVTTAPGRFSSLGIGGSSRARPAVNGNRQEGNAFLLDGIPIDETIENRVGFKPNVDALAEFRVETSNSSSEFGNVTGAVVNATVKSGGNEFHGNVFEFFRNDALDANDWENNRNGASKQKLRQNVFGGTLGGPIIKNKLFFFGAYQGSIQRTGGGASANVAPAEWREGNLSSLLRLSTPVYIRDPQKAGACNSASQVACFPGNIIPAARIVNPAAKALFADTTLYPAPNSIDPLTQVGIFNTRTSNQLVGRQFDIKIDARLSDHDNVSARYSFANLRDVSPQGALPVILTSSGLSRPRNIVLNWTRAFSPTIVNEARVGLNRATSDSLVFDWAGIGNANAKLGIPGTQAVPGLSLIALGNGLTNLGSRAVNTDSVSNTFLYGDNLRISRGRHFFKMGGQLQRYQQNRFYPGNSGLLGGFTYSNGTYTGAGFADFLLDLMTNKSIGNTGGANPGTWGHRQSRLGFFFQDDYKVRNNLTLNLGIRWEHTAPIVEVKDRQSNFDPISGRFLLAGKDGASRALYDPYYKGFEPRIGFAWTPAYFGDKLVARAGYGITQFMEGMGANLRLPLNFPFFSEANVTYASGAANAGTIKTGFADVIVGDRPSGQIRIWDPDLRPQFTQQWNLTLEYQFTGSLSLSAAYVGHRATHLVTPTDYNQPVAGPADVAPSQWAPINTRRPLFGPLPSVGQVNGTASWGISNYNSLQVSARQRLAKGLEFMAAYTFSKTLTDNVGFFGVEGVAASSPFSYNQYGQRLYNYGPAAFDARNNFVFSISYELPAGKSRKFGAALHPVVNAILGGWNMSSILQFRSGFPLTVTTSVDNTFQNPRGGQKPDLIGNPVPDHQGLDNWINLAAFARPKDGTFGNSPIGVIRAPGYANWDFGLGKKFYVLESQYFDFRAEFFNFTNHPSFGSPGRNFNDVNTFGKITTTVSAPRILEFVLKYHF